VHIHVVLVITVGHLHLKTGPIRMDSY
jgi:hypothetical protein